MELNKQQLQQVESYLDKKDIIYIDIRTEIFDHIVSYIETIMECEKLDFETVFYSVTNKWNVHLKLTSSFYFGPGYSLPKIVIEKAKKHFKKWFFFSIIAFFIPLILINRINVIYYESIKNELNVIFQILIVFTFIAFALLFILNLREKKKSTYSFVLKTQNWNFMLGVILLFDLDFFNKSGNFQASQIAILVAFIFSTFTYFHFYRKHKKSIKKYKVS